MPERWIYGYRAKPNKKKMGLSGYGYVDHGLRGRVGLCESAWIGTVRYGTVHRRINNAICNTWYGMILLVQYVLRTACAT